MKKRTAWLAAVGTAAVVVAISLVARQENTEWTTSSRAAHRELERAIEARLKMYQNDAVGHLESAIKLDPEFVFAKLQLAEMLQSEAPQRAETLFGEALSADVDRLRPRERFFILRADALREESFGRAARLTRDYLDQNPDDPYIIEIVANDAKTRGDFQAAERLYRRLLEVAPNWVAAYSWLGYLTMTQGRFSEAEEYFTSYRFIAPDQANAHDSLAELYIIRGRYDEADIAVNMAIEMRADFWPAYLHMVQARGMMRDFLSAREAIDRWADQPGVSARELKRMRCTVDVAELDFSRSWSRLVENASSPCYDRDDPAGYVSRAIHRAACQKGDWAVATRLEDRLHELIERARQRSTYRSGYEAWSALLHMEGVRLALKGNLESAEERFRKADSYLTYHEAAPGLFKLVTRLMLAETLFAQSRDGEAHRLLSEVRTVNPAMASEFEADGFSWLGLDRG